MTKSDAAAIRAAIKAMLDAGDHIDDQSLVFAIEGLQLIDLSPRWKTIETAPRDREVNLWIPGYGAQCGGWDSDNCAKRPKPYWAWGICLIYAKHQRANQPTHWAELDGGPEE